MSAKSEAAKEFAKEQELVKLRAAKEATAQAKLDRKEAYDAKLAAMDEPERAKFLKRRKISKITVGLMAFGILVAVITFGGGSKSSPTSSAPSADFGAQLSCQDFHSLLSDIKAGIVADSELRGKFKGIYSEAQGSSNMEIISDAQAMLAADTSNDSAAMATASGAFLTACATVGQ